MTRQLQRARAAGRAALQFAAALAVASCNTDSLLSVKTPDQIPPGQVNNAAGAQALRVSALGNFETMLGGDVGGSGVGVNIASGLMADELISARGGTEHMDSRAENDALFPATAWTWVGQTTTQIIRAIAALNQYPPTPLVTSLSKNFEVGQLYAYQGFAFTMTGENFCNGVPIANANDAAPETKVLSNADLFTRATAQFDSASATIGTADATITNLAAVGKGRALLDLGKFPEAAAAVASVPTSFVWAVQYSKSTTSIVNAVYDWMVATPNFGPSEKEGGNGLNFITANDPRVPIDPKTKPGQDGTLIVTLLLFPTTDAPITLASGVEARLIEAEAMLKADPSDAVNYLAKLNAARASRASLALAPLTDPGSATARQDLLFRERAFWMYLTAHRMGDLRRLVRQYNRPSETVWPTGRYFKGGNYGPDMNLKPSQAETNNKAWKVCTNRDA